MFVTKAFKPFSCFLIFISVLTISNAKLNLFDWQTYTSMANVRNADFDSQGRIWAGTSGGVFIYNPIDNKFIEIRNTEGLISQDITTIAFNKNKNKFYIGSKDGYLYIVSDNTENLDWKYITDIVSAQFPNPEIDDIIFNNEFAYISGGFGLAKFSQKDNVFLETVVRFGDFPTNTKVNKILIFDNYIWAATDAGLARAKLNSTISNPASWQTYTTDSGLPDNATNLLLVSDSTLYLATNSTICKFEDDSIKTIATSKDNAKIVSMINQNGKILYATSLQIFDLKNQVINTKYYWQNINTLLYDSQKDNIYILYSAYGMSKIIGNDNFHIIPNTPLTNNFMNLDVDNKGRLWVATRSKETNNGKGFAMLDKKGKWLNFTPQKFSPVDNECMKIKAFDDGKVFVSTWGSGMIMLEDANGGFTITKYDTSNSPLISAIGSNKNYIITGEALEDKNGLKWIINYGQEVPGPLLLALDKDNNFHQFNNNLFFADRQYLELAIDHWGTKWLGSYKFSKGLFYFNENGTIDDESDDIAGIITKSNSSLYDNEQTSLAVDRNGVLWIGTSSGLNYIYDTSPILSNNKIYVREIPQLRSQYINDIYVDALNNKWIATTKGVWVLNSDGSELLNKKIINSENSPLVDDDVYSITSNPETGIIYLGTKKGLSAVKTLSVAPLAEYDIKCYPQPFNPDKDEYMFIDGLKQFNDVRILTTDGVLVKSMSAIGRKTVWDGKDENGNFVANGIYLIVGSSATAGGSGVGKFAVLRK